MGIGLVEALMKSNAVHRMGNTNVLAKPGRRGDSQRSTSIGKGLRMAAPIIMLAICGYQEGGTAITVVMQIEREVNK